MGRPLTYPGWVSYQALYPIPRGAMGDVGSFYSLWRLTQSWNTPPPTLQGYGSPWGHTEMDEGVPTQPSPVPTAPAIPTDLIPLITDLSAQVSDPYAAAAVYRERAARARRLGFHTRANVLEARARAADRRIQVKSQSEASAQEWSSLGKLAVIAGIGVGVSMIFFFFAKGLK